MKTQNTGESHEAIEGVTVSSSLAGQYAQFDADIVRAGYVLTRHFEELGLFKTLRAAKRCAAMIHRMDTERIEVA
jgi:hypothetical protein